MTINELTTRDQLIVRILHMPDAQVDQLAELVENMDNDPNWSDEGITAAELTRRNQIDQAAIDASRGETGIPLEDVLRELGIA